MANLTAREMLESPDFKKLVSKRWSVSLVLLAGVFIVYYGYIMLIAYNHEFMASKINPAGVTTWGIPLGVATIVLAWVLTMAYVLWANTSYDNEVKRLREQMEGRR